MEEIRNSEKPTVVLSKGKPVAAIVALNRDDLDDYWYLGQDLVLEALQRAEANLQKGRVRPAAEVFGEIDAREAEEATSSRREPTAARSRASRARG